MAIRFDSFCCRHDADPNVRDKLGRRAGDSLCGTINGVSGRVGVGGGSGGAAGGAGATAISTGGATQGTKTKTENEPFSETRSLLAVARAQRATRRGRSNSIASSSTTPTARVHVKSRDAVGGSAAVGGNASCTHGGTAGMPCGNAGAGSAGHVDPGPGRWRKFLLLYCGVSHGFCLIVLQLWEQHCMSMWFTGTPAAPVIVRAGAPGCDSVLR